MQLYSINERVVGIRESEYEVNRFVEEYKPFIASCTEKVAGRYVRYGEDDELSIAMLAFVESIKAYDSSKGNFLPFSQNVIKRRLIDYYRKEKRNLNVISLNEYTEIGEDEIDLSAGEALQMYSVKEESEYRRFELEQLKKELGSWDISFFDLTEVSPKQAKTRNVCSNVTKYLLSRPDLVRVVKEKRYLPVAEIVESLGVPRKFIERSRKYIIAVVIISTGDYQYIQDYVSF